MSKSRPAGFFYEWTVLFGVLLGLGGFIGYTHFIDYRHIDERERDRLAHQTEIVEKNLAPQLIATNRAIEGIVDELPSWKSEKDGLKKVARRLKVIDDSLAGVSPIMILKADGTVISSSDEKLIGMNFAEREYFQTALKNPDPGILHISKPFKTVVNTFVISLFRTIPGPAGEFDGIVIVSAVPEYFSTLLDSVRYAPDARASIVHGDGKVFMVSPPQTGVDAKDLAIPGTLFTRHRESGQAASLFTGTTYVGGGERMVALRTIAIATPPTDKSLVVTVSRPSAEIFSAWRKGIYLQSLLYVVLVIISALGLSKNQRGRRDRHTERKQSENRIRDLLREQTLMFDNAHVGIGMVRQRKLLHCNQRMAEIFGYDKPEQMEGKSASILYCSPEEYERVGDHLYPLMAKHGIAQGDVEMCQQDGTHITVMLSGRPVDPSAVAEGSIWVYTDITEAKRTEQRLHQQIQFSDDIINSLPGVFYMLDPQGRLIRVNHRLLEVTGYSRDELDHMSALDLFDEDDRGLIARKMQEVFETGEETAEVAFRIKSGGKIPYHFTGHRTFIADQPYLVGIGTDITDRIRAEKALRESEKHIRVLFNSGNDPIFVYQIESLSGAPQGSFVEVNDVACYRLGYSREELLRMRPEDIIAPDAAAHPAPNVKLALNREVVYETCHRTQDGRVIPVEINARVFELYDRALVFAMARDITERKAAEDEIKHLAFYDSLTQLPNRRLMLDRLQQALANSVRRNRHGALMMIDLDNFKALNDTMGHDVGDQLLMEVAVRLDSSVRQGDTVARLGGDEFVVILEDLDETKTAAMQAEFVANKILTKLSQAYELDIATSDHKLGKHSHHCTSSIGITLFRDHSVTSDELMKRADTAMYQAKGAGRNTLRFFDPEMQTTVKARVACEVDLRKAVVGSQFLLHYQAQVDLSGRVTGAEALVRWQHPDRGLVSPLEFIPLAEETGLILPIGHWVLQTACAQLAAWAKTPDTSHLSLAVNVSARQFSLPNFVEQVMALLEYSGARPDKLKLELTESLLLENAEDIVAKMITLKNLGVGFSMDDFGTGYSSLSYLKRLPLDQLKIDQSFVRDVLTDPNDAAIAKTIIALGQSLGIAVIAEGVETQGQYDVLANLGCQAYQGFFFSRPLPIDGFGEFALNRFDTPHSP